MKNLIKLNLSYDDFLKNRQNFLIWNEAKKFEFIQNHVIGSNGLPYSTLKNLVEKTTKFFIDSVKRDLELIPYRTKLVYRNYPNISGRW